MTDPLPSPAFEADFPGGRLGPRENLVQPSDRCEGGHAPSGLGWIARGAWDLGPWSPAWYPSSMSKPSLYLCTGKDCRERTKRYSALIELANDLPLEIVEVRCQEICKGPVVGRRCGEGVEWFGRMKGKKTLRSLTKLVKKGKIDKRLEKRRAKERSGKLRT